MQSQSVAQSISSRQDNSIAVDPVVVVARESMQQAERADALERQAIEQRKRSDGDTARAARLEASHRELADRALTLGDQLGSMQATTLDGAYVQLGRVNAIIEQSLGDDDVAYLDLHDRLQLRRLVYSIAALLREHTSTTAHELVSSDLHDMQNPWLVN